MCYTVSARRSRPRPADMELTDVERVRRAQGEASFMGCRLTTETPAGGSCARAMQLGVEESDWRSVIGVHDES